MISGTLARGALEYFSDLMFKWLLNIFRDQTGKSSQKRKSEKRQI